MADEEEKFGVFVEATNQDPAIPQVFECEKCPCGGEIETGYGLAGGGCGIYSYCGTCGKMLSKTQDCEE